MVNQAPARTSFAPVANLTAQNGRDRGERDAVGIGSNGPRLCDDWRGPPICRKVLLISLLAGAALRPEVRRARLYK